MFNNKKGFTLVEIVVVLTIMAILAAMAAPSLLGYIDDVDNSTYLSEGKSVLKYTQLNIAKLNSKGKTDWTDLTELTSTYLGQQDLKGEISDVLFDASSRQVRGFNYKIDGKDKYVNYNTNHDPNMWISDSPEVVSAIPPEAIQHMNDFREYIAQNYGDEFENTEKTVLYQNYYPTGINSVKMTDEYRNSLIEHGLMSSLAKKSLYWWSYPVTNNKNELLYIATFANEYNDASWWQGDGSNRTSINKAYVAIANGKVYLRTGNCVSPGNGYETEDALEAALIKNGYIEYLPS